MGLSHKGHRYRERNFAEYQETITLMKDRELGQHAEEVGALPLSNRFALLDLLEMNIWSNTPKKRRPQRRSARRFATLKHPRSR